MTARAELQALVAALPEELPDEALQRIKRVLEQEQARIRLEALAPLTPERDAELREALAALRRGEGIDGDAVFAALERLDP